MIPERTSFRVRTAQPGGAPVSLEVLPKDIDKIPLIAANFVKGTRVYITLIKEADLPKQVLIAKAIHAAGLEPVPHIPACHFKGHGELEAHLRALTEAGVKEALVLGGNQQAGGAFDSALKLLETGLFEKYGIRRIGLAGHPEGNKAITSKHGDAALMDALKQKQAYLQAHGMQGHIVTQFFFDAAPVVKWAEQLRAEGITLPVHVGLPGPGDLTQLMNHARRCEVSIGQAFAKVGSTAILGAFFGHFSPNKLVGEVTNVSKTRPELGIEGLHFYSFSNVDGLIAWMGENRAAARQ